MADVFDAVLAEHAEVLEATRATLADAREATDLVIDALQQGGMILFCGNGGSATDADHLAGELVGRFLRDRKALPAIALAGSAATLTAVSNDYGYEQGYARQVRAYARPSCVLVAISTSGNSASILRAAEAAREQGAKVIGMTGRTGGKLAELCDVCIRVPSDVTARIQEMHITLGHALCQAVEDVLCPIEG